LRERAGDQAHERNVHNCSATIHSVVDKVIIEKVEGGTWPNWVGTEQKRPIISLTGDEMKLSTPAASVGGTAENTYKRIK